MKKIFLPIVIIFFLIFLLFKYYQTIAKNSIITMTGFKAVKFSKRMDDILSKSVLDSKGHISRNAAVAVQIPLLNYKYAGARGLGRSDTGEKMTLDHQFFISSVGKAITAAVIMQLSEEGAFGEKGLDATLGELKVFPPEVLDVLHLKDGISYGRQITIRELLNHTTGLKNVDNDSENDIGENYPDSMGYAPGSLNYLDVYDKKRGFEAALRFIREGIPADGKLSDYYLFQPLSEWDYQAWRRNPSDKLAGQLNFFLGGTNKNALFKPGESMYYSDTNYLLLGIIIEIVTGQSLDQVKNERIFKPLGMKHTYCAGADSPSAIERKGRLSDYWADNQSLVSLGINIARMDKGDGAEISTLADMTAFIRALAHGKLFKKKTTLNEMLKLPFGGDFGYAGGIVLAKTDTGYLLTHNGSSGAWIEYYPKFDLSIVGTVNEINPERMMKFRAQIFHALEEAGIKSSTFKYGPGIINLLFAVQKLSPITPFLLLFGSILIFLSVILVWPFIALYNLRKKVNNQNTFKIGYIWPAVTSAIINLVFLFAFAYEVSGNSNQIMIEGYTPLLKILLILPVFSLCLAIILSANALLIWKNGYWKPGKRIYYTTITMASFGFLVFLYLMDILFILF